MTAARKAPHAWAALVAAVAVGLPAAAQKPTLAFRSGVEAAYVDVFVSRGDAPVTGLRSQDFELRDDGIPQPVELVAAEALPLQALLVFDTSSSLTGAERAALRRAGDTLLAVLGKEDEAGLMTFAEEIRWGARPTRDREAMRRALDGLEPQGASVIYDALLAALAASDPRGRALVILFTDGVDNTSVLDARHLMAFIYHYTVVHRRSPAEADLQEFFEVTPPSVHQMVLTLHRRSLIERIPGRARSIRVLVPRADLPELFDPRDVEGGGPRAT